MTSNGVQASYTATHYGESYHGQRMGCTGAPYDTNDPTIVAVGPANYARWPCGATLIITGPTNIPLQVTRQDSCPGCHSTMIDLSEAGILIVCSGLHTCKVEVSER